MQLMLDRDHWGDWLQVLNILRSLYHQRKLVRVQEYFCCSFI